MKRVVIESPYAGDVDTNVKYAKECVMDCLKRGEAPYASHLFFTQEGLLNDDDPTERDLGIKAGLEWGRSADYVVVYVDHGISKGMERGISSAISRGKKLVYRSLINHVKPSEVLESFLSDYPSLKPFEGSYAVWGAGLGRDESGNVAIDIFGDDDINDVDIPKKYTYRNIPYKVRITVAPRPTYVS